MLSLQNNYVLTLGPVPLFCHPDYHCACPKVSLRHPVLIVHVPSRRISSPTSGTGPLAFLRRSPGPFSRTSDSPPLPLRVCNGSVTCSCFPAYKNCLIPFCFLLRLITLPMLTLLLKCREHYS